MKYFFLFAPNNSGTTVMSQYLAGQLDAYLPPFGNNEGLMMPGLRPPRDNMLWNPDHPWDWPAIKALWDPLPAAQGKDLFVEASPSNILHVDAIRDAFGHHHKALFSMASPYAFVASVLANYHRWPLTTQKLDLAAQRWQVRAEAMQANRAAHPDIPFLSYEDFCADPAALNRLCDLPLRARVEIAGKANSGERRIQDQTPRHVGYLSAAEWDRVTARLAERPELLATHGYALTPGDDLHAAARAAAPDLFGKGRTKRARWERRWSTPAQRVLAALPPLRRLVDRVRG